jgi:23S rRNA pseudouridine2605 synthase
MTDNKGERLQKVLARAGIASRRHAEDLITAGRVRVNGKVVDTLGARVASRRDKVEVDGVRIVAEAPVYLVFHKPRGVVTTLNDPEGRPTIKESLEGVAERVFPVGRLDFHTSGVLLLTNDGDLAQALLHPRRSVAKTYVAKVRGIVTDLQLEPWRTGMILPATPSDPDERPAPTLPADVRVLRTTPPAEATEFTPATPGSTWLQVTLREGRTRQIHRMAEATGLFVMRLARIAFAGITSDGLRPGQWRNLSDKEVTALRVRYLRPVEMGEAPEVLEPLPVPRTMKGAKPAAELVMDEEDEATPAFRRGPAPHTLPQPAAAAPKRRKPDARKPAGAGGRGPGAGGDRRGAGASAPTGGGRRGGRGGAPTPRGYDRPAGPAEAAPEGRARRGAGGGRSGGRGGRGGGGKASGS